MPRLTRRSAAAKEDTTPEVEETAKTSSRSRRGAQKEESKPEEAAEVEDVPSKRGGRQPPKAKPAETKGKAGKSRSKKGAKEEESEEEQVEAEEEEEEQEKTKGKGKGGRGATKGRRSAGGKGDEDSKDGEEGEEEKEEKTPDTKAKASGGRNKKSTPVTPSPKGGRKTRGKAAAEPAEEEAKEEAKETPEATPEKSTNSKSTSAEETGSGRRGRAQKSATPSSKTPPSRPRRGAAPVVPESEKAKEEAEEAMEITEEAKPQEEFKQEDTSAKKEEKSGNASKKRKLGEGEDESEDREAKRLRESEPAAESAEPELSEFVVVNKEDVPPADSKEVLDILPPAQPVKPETSHSSELELSPVGSDVQPPMETCDATFVVPLTEAELAKQYVQQHKQQQDGDETSSTLVEVGSEPASDITSISRGLDFSDAVSLDSSVTGDQSDQPMGGPISDESGCADRDGMECTEVAMEKLGNEEADPPSDQNSRYADSSHYLPSSPDILDRKLILNPEIPPEHMDPASCFSVVSYNILADCHLKRGDYSYRKPQFLEQSHRHFILMKEIDYLDGDIVCMQEVAPTYYQDKLLPDMASRGYVGHFIKRTKEYWDEGAATFVKQSKFSVVSYKGLSLRDLAYRDVDSFNLNPSVSAAVKKYLDRADVLLLTQLKMNKTGQTITVGNIHVVYDVEALDVQCIQVACAIKELVKSAGGSDLNPYIICGDFNSTVESPAYQLAKEGYLSDVNIKKLQGVTNLELQDESQSKALINHIWGAFQHTSVRLQSAYQTILKREPLCTSYTKTTDSTLDYIFYSSLSLDTIGVLETVDDKVVRASGGLPTSSIPSDHLSLKAVFRSREEKN